MFQVVTGEYKPTDDNIERRIYNVTSIIEHEEYDPETIVNDIALLKVQKLGTNHLSTDNMTHESLLQLSYLGHGYYLFYR